MERNGTNGCSILQSIDAVRTTPETPVCQKFTCLPVFLCWNDRKGKSVEVITDVFTHPFWTVLDFLSPIQIIEVLWEKTG